MDVSSPPVPSTGEKTGRARNHIAEIEITGACNANCIFCPRHLATKSSAMGRKTFEQVLRRLIQADIRDVKLAGFGEPTLHPELMVFLRTMREHGLRPQLNTNGSLLHRLDLDELLDLCDEVIVSLHSLDPKEHRRITGTECFDNVIEGFEELLRRNKRRRRRITIYCVATLFNRDSLDAFERYASQADLRVSGCSNRIIEGFGDELFDVEANERLNHYRPVSDSDPICGYAMAATVIDSEGRYLLCTNDMLKQTGSETVWDIGIGHARAALYESMKNGRFMPLCDRCENSEAYRERMHRRIFEDSPAAGRRRRK